jgi:capsid protein
MSPAESFGEYRADYDAARLNRFQKRRLGLNPAGSGADYHYRIESDYLRLIEFSRDSDRNHCMIGQMINRAVENAIQGGFQLTPDTGSDKLNAALAARWKNWSTDADQCDVAGEMTWLDMEHLSLRHMFVDGDIIALGLEAGQLEMIEAHRIRTPSGTKKNVVNGVLLEGTRKRVEYWVTKDDIDPLAALR